MTDPKPSATDTPAPTPAPSGGNQSVAQMLAGLNAAADGGTTGGKKKNPDLYGLGEWQGQNVNPGDLPITASLIAGGKNTHAEDVVKAFAQGTPDQIATIQHALLMAGDYYPSGFTPKWGVVSQQDVAAFAKAVRTAGQSNQSVSDLLTTQASYGATMGVQAAQQQSKASKIATINMPNAQDLEAEASLAFQKILGRKATPEQQARFAAFYRSMSAAAQRQQAQQEYDAQNGAPLPANIDPAQAVSDAQTLPTTPMAGPIIPGHPRPGITDSGEAVVPMTGPVAGNRPMVDAGTGKVVNPSFTDKIGGLMSLGQAVAQATNTAQPGLSFVTDNSAVPSPTVAAENYARNADPKGAAANDLGSTFNTFLGLLSRNFG